MAVGGLGCQPSPAQSVALHAPPRLSPLSDSRNAPSCAAPCLGWGSHCGSGSLPFFLASLIPVGLGAHLRPGPHTGTGHTGTGAARRAARRLHIRCSSGCSSGRQRERAHAHARAGWGQRGQGAAGRQAGRQGGRQGCLWQGGRKGMVVFVELHWACGGSGGSMPCRDALSVLGSSRLDVTLLPVLSHDKGMIG
jgi:hypothetical protein